MHNLNLYNIFYLKMFLSKTVVHLEFKSARGSGNNKFLVLTYTKIGLKILWEGNYTPSYMRPWSKIEK